MSRNLFLPALACVLALFLGRLSLAAESTPSQVEPIGDGVIVVRNDSGSWGGSTKGMTHQRGPHYQAKKVLDLSEVPEADFAATQQVRLSAHFCVRDYSWHDAEETNALDETIEIVVNDHVLSVPMNTPGLPAMGRTESVESAIGWYDFTLPRDWIVRGRNEIVFRIGVPEGKSRPDDYIYLGIDTTVPGHHSWVRFSKTSPWQQDRHTATGGQGEYMVRLYLVQEPLDFAARYDAATDKLDDPAGVVAYAGDHLGPLRIEWDPDRIDWLEPLSLSVEKGGGKLSLAWLDASGNPLPATTGSDGPTLQAERKPPQAERCSGVELTPADLVRALKIRGARDYHPHRKPIDMAPRVAEPAGKPANGAPTCRIEAEAIRLAAPRYRCVFSCENKRLKLVSFFNNPAAAEMVRCPDAVALFLTEIEGKRTAGSRDYHVTQITPLDRRPGFRATLVENPTSLQADLTVWAGERLHMALKLTNAGERPIDFKVAFPHLSGLAISDEAAEDYYFFPRGGGIIANVAAHIRQGYGDHQALYQLVDIFSPARGAGLAVQTIDTEGRYKVVALRKYLPGEAEVTSRPPRTPTEEAFKWSENLEATPGIGVAYEYLRRTRAPGQSFEPPPASFWPHEGDWHVAMEDYAAWCHEQWTFRPWPSRLATVHNMLAAGWGRSPIFRDGKYRTDFVKPETDCLELMSWWEWSPVGPKGIPLDQVADKLGQAKYDRWDSYFVEDPVTGKLMFSNNPGDYDGYNQRWGGLPALREAIDRYRAMGALVTLYTDPFRVDHASKCGKQYGKRFGVVRADGTYRDDYDAWRMCHDAAEYRQWVAREMKRVLRETGADGIRLDEYGHCGSACFSREHEHTFAEWGCTEWQRGVTEATRRIRNAMDEVDPRSVLTTEHPGYDFLMPQIEGCITYDLTVLSSVLRPVECNTQRFYFPECKAFELDHRGADRNHHKRFWNAVGSFGSYYPEPMYRILREHHDALGSRRATPLVPTLAQYVYANRFQAPESHDGSPGKTIWTLYNATGHTFAGEAIEVSLGPEERLVELLHGRPLEIAREGDRAIVSLFMPRDDVACIARLPK